MWPERKVRTIRGSGKGAGSLSRNSLICYFGVPGNVLSLAKERRCRSVKKRDLQHPRAAVSFLRWSGSESLVEVIHVVRGESYLLKILRSESNGGELMIALVRKLFLSRFQARELFFGDSSRYVLKSPWDKCNIRNSYVCSSARVLWCSKMFEFRRS